MKLELTAPLVRAPVCGALCVCVRSDRPLSARVQKRVVYFLNMGSLLSTEAGRAPEAGRVSHDSTAAGRTSPPAMGTIGVEDSADSQSNSVLLSVLSTN